MQVLCQAEKIRTGIKNSKICARFRQGGPAGYGLRRVLIDQSGSVKGQLSRGEHKSLQTDRVILQPGPHEEVAVVNQIYRWFVEDALFESEIAERLNTKGIQTDLGRDWTRATVREVLSNEKYIGNNVYNRRSFKLKKVRVVNQPDMWIKKEGAFEGIVPPDLYYTAQGILRARAHRFSNDELIEKLRRLFQQHGYGLRPARLALNGRPPSSITKETKTDPRHYTYPQPTFTGWPLALAQNSIGTVAQF